MDAARDPGLQPGGPAGLHVEIDEDDRATVVFGDGAFGRQPARGAAIRATYRVGGGAAGNVPGGCDHRRSSTLRSSRCSAPRSTNPDPATGGADRESIEHAVQHAPAVFRSLRARGHAADYEALA